MKVIILSLPVGSFCRINVAYPADPTRDKQYLADTLSILNCAFKKAICILVFTFSKVRSSAVA
jgi:hypothetical protein